MKRFALVLGCAAVALTAAASAQTHDRLVVRHHHSGHAADIDADNDGWVTRAEASAAAERAFAALDTDQDGRLSTQDRQSHHIEIRMDGGLDAHRAERDAERAARHAERAARHAEREAERHAERIERDGEREERRVVIIERGENLEAPEPPHPPRPPRPPMFLMLLANSEEADLNGDGALSRDEFRAQHLRFFDASDANGDGRIRFTPPPLPPEPPTPPAPPR
jgi:hypothetical protein